MSNTARTLEKPSWLLLLAEMRAVAEFGLTLASAPVLLTAPRGDGHPVLVLPGLLAGDLSTVLLRRYLAHLCYEVHPWKLGRNVGGVYRMRTAVRDRIAHIRSASGRKVSLIGWSLGGVYARDAAVAMPESIRSVITLGSPFANDLTATNVGSIYAMLSGESAATANPDDVRALGGDLSVPTTAIYTKADGIVNWRTSVLQENDRSENIEILFASHSGLGVNPAVLWAIADRLRIPEGEFEPFSKDGPFSSSYANADRMNREQGCPGEQGR
jgi:pimeloyl-ACP methyl ester carboxylesterase